jgi:hypothetical protein
LNGTLRAQAPRALAIAALAFTFQHARLPNLDLWQRTPAEPAKLATLAAGFHFEPQALPVVCAPGDAPGIRTEGAYFVRRVHPSLQHLRSWISSVGAGVAVGDLDGDGWPNDAVHVDTRSNSVVVAPVPGVSRRHPAQRSYPAFSLLDQLPSRSGRGAPGDYDPSTCAPMGALIGDFNEDGRADILVYFWGRPPLLFLRRDAAEPGRQVAITKADYAVQELVTNCAERWFTNAVIQTDLDGDGHLDLVVCNYFADGARILDGSDPASNEQAMPANMSAAFNGGRKHLLVWRSAEGAPSPRATFEPACDFLDDATLAAQVQGGWTLAAGATDLDGDGRDELFLINDFGPDRILRNLSRPGEVRFALLSGEADARRMKSGVPGKDSNKGMGIAFGDLEGNGRLGVLVSNITTRWGLQESQFAFAHTYEAGSMEVGKAPLTNKAELLGLSRTGWGWDVRFADFDNNGRQEIVQALGFIKGEYEGWANLHESATGNDLLLRFPGVWHNYEPGVQLSAGDPMALFAWDGRRFQNLATAMRSWDRDLPADSHGQRIEGAPVTRGLALADCEHDGRLDLFTANQYGPSYVYHNHSPAGAYVGLRLLWPLRPGRAEAMEVAEQGEESVAGRPAIGATATVYLPGGRELHAQVDGGSGHSGKDSAELHFGVGAVAAGTSLWADLHWRDPEGTLRQQWLRVQAGAPGMATEPGAGGGGWHTVLLGWPAAQQQ